MIDTPVIVLAIMLFVPVLFGAMAVTAVMVLDLIVLGVKGIIYD